MKRIISSCLLFIFASSDFTDSGASEGLIEMKYAQEDRMEAACTEALKQIEQRQYAARLKSDGMKNIVNYGIACYRKHCKVKIGKENS